MASPILLRSNSNLSSNTSPNQTAHGTPTEPHHHHHHHNHHTRHRLLRAQSPSPTLGQTHTISQQQQNSQQTPVVIRRTLLNTSTGSILPTRLLPSAANMAIAQAQQNPSMTTTTSVATITASENYQNSSKHYQQQRYDNSKHLFIKANEINDIITASSSTVAAHSDTNDFNSYMQNEFIEVPLRQQHSDSARNLKKKKKRVSFNENLLKIHLIPAYQTSSFFQNQPEDSKYEVCSSNYQSQANMVAAAQTTTSMIESGHVKYNTLNTPILLTSKKPLNSKFFKTIRTLKHASSVDNVNYDPDEMVFGRKSSAGLVLPTHLQQSKTLTMYLSPPLSQATSDNQTSSAAQHSSIPSTISAANNPNLIKLAVKSIEFRNLNNSRTSPTRQLVTTANEIKIKQLQQRQRDIQNASPSLRVDQATPTSSHHSQSPIIRITDAPTVDSSCDHMASVIEKENSHSVSSNNGTVTITTTQPLIKSSQAALIAANKRLRATLRPNGTPSNGNLNTLNEIWKEIDRAKQSQQQRQDVYMSQTLPRVQQQQQQQHNTDIATYLNPDLAEIGKKLDDAGNLTPYNSVTTAATAATTAAVSNVNNLRIRNLNTSPLTSDMNGEFKKRSVAGLPLLYENSITNIKLFNLNGSSNSTNGAGAGSGSNAQYRSQPTLLTNRSVSTRHSPSQYQT